MLNIGHDPHSNLNNSKSNEKKYMTSNKLGDAVVSYIKEKKMKNASFSMKELKVKFPSVSRHKLGGYIGRMRRDGFLTLKEGTKDVYFFTNKSIDNLRMHFSVPKEDHNVSHTETYIIPHSDVQESIKKFDTATFSSPSEYNKQAEIKIETKAETKQPLSNNQFVEALLELAGKAETIKPDLSKVSNEELMAELQRRIIK